MFMKKKQVCTGTVVVLHFLIKKIHLFFNWTTDIKISFKVVLVKSSFSLTLFLCRVKPLD